MDANHGNEPKGCQLLVLLKTPNITSWTHQLSFWRIVFDPDPRWDCFRFIIVVMAKNILEEDIFKVLKQRGIQLNTHVENIFRFTGYNNARTIANFNCANGVEEIEECVRSTLGKKDRHDKMDRQKRTATFGEWFADDPCDFVFFPGERSAILLAVDMAKTIVAEYDQRKRKLSLLDGSSDKRHRVDDGNDMRLTSSTSSSSTTSNTEHTAGPSNATGSHTSILSSNASQVTNQQSSQPVLRKGKTLAEYLFSWLEKTQYDIKYDASQCQIDLINPRITCTACNIRKPFQVYEANGCWKLAVNFLNHLKTCHKSVPATGAQPNVTPANKIVNESPQ